MKTRDEIAKFVAENGCNPAFWLDTLQNSIYCSESGSKNIAQQNAHDKLKQYIDFIES